MSCTPARAAVALLACLVAGCGTPAPEPEPGIAPAPPPPEGVELPPASPVFGWRCENGDRLVSRYDPASGALLLVGDGLRARLAQVPSASGARWAAGDTDFHSRGDGALVVRGAQRTRCRADPVATADARAAVAGAVFRALGNEPGWSVEIHPGHIRWIGDYGRIRRRFREVSLRGGGTAQRWRGRDDAGSIRVRIEDAPCRDAGDRSFPATAYVAVDGAELRGCGRPLADPFAEACPGGSCEPTRQDTSRAPARRRPSGPSR